MATIHDVARASGFSIATVSRALSGEPRVHDDTRAKIERVARELGYQSNAVARALRQNLSRTIGLVIPDLENEFYTSGAAILQDVLTTAGYRLILCCNKDDPATDQEAMRSLIDRRVDGIAHVPCTPAGAELVRKFDPDIPIVELNRRSDADSVDAVIADEERGSAELVAHLASLGHRRIAMLAGGEHLSTTQARVRGFRRTLTLQHLKPAHCPILYGTYSVGWGRSGTQDILRMAEASRPTALFASSSQLALGTLNALAEAHISIPEQMSVVAFSNPDWFQIANPPLTTYELPLREMGLMAAQLLLNRLQSKVLSDPRPSIVSFEGKLVLRSSTAPPSLEV